MQADTAITSCWQARLLHIDSEHHCDNLYAPE